MTAIAQRKRLPRAAWIALASARRAGPDPHRGDPGRPRCAPVRDFYGVVPQTAARQRRLRSHGPRQGRHPADPGQLGRHRPGSGRRRQQLGQPRRDRRRRRRQRGRGAAVHLRDAALGRDRPRRPQLRLELRDLRAEVGGGAQRVVGRSLATWSTATGRKGSSGPRTHSISKLPIDSCQFWNEPNSRSFYRPKPKPKAYAKLIGRCQVDSRQSIRRRRSCSAGWPSSPARRRRIRDPSTWRSSQGARLKGELRRRRDPPIRRQAERGDRADRAVPRGDQAGQGEAIGALDHRDRLAGSKKGGNPLNRGKSGQAKLLKQSFKYFKRKRNALNVEQVDWFSWMDSPTSICAWCSSSGPVWSRDDREALVEGVHQVHRRQLIDDTRSLI